MATKQAQTAPRAEYLANLAVTPVIDSFADWIEQETGTTLTERERVVLYLGSALRGDFQKSPANQRRIAEQIARVAAEKAARQKRAAERAAEPVKPQPATKKAPAKKAARVKAPVRRRPLKVEATA
jgi:hypothetical protein